MKDKISIDRACQLHPAIRQTVIDTITDIENEEFAGSGTKIRIVQGLRTFAEQDELYAQGRTKKGAKVTNAKGGQSIHNYGLAFDFCLMYPDANGNYTDVSWDTKKDFNKDQKADWLQVINRFKNKGFEWGGDWKSIVDTPHLEKTFGYSWQKLLVKYQDKNFIKGTGYVDL